MTFSNNIVVSTVTFTSSSGSFNNLSFTNNTLTTTPSFNISGNGINILGNIALASMRIWDVTGAYTITKANISNNSIGTTLYICYVNTSSATTSFTISKIAGNICGSNLEIMSSFTASGTTTFSNNIISDNSALLFYFFPSTGTLNASTTISGNSFFGNRFTTSASFRNGNVAPAANITLSGLTFSNNTLGGLSFDEYFSIDDLTISNNVFTGSLYIYVIPVTGTSTYRDIIISNNIFGSNVAINIGYINVVIYNFIFTNNIMPNNDLKIISSGAAVLNTYLNAWNISNNLIRAIAFNAVGGNAASTISLYFCTISNNGFSGDTAAIAGTTWEPGIYLTKGALTGLTSIVDGLTISGNFAAPFGATVPETQFVIANGAGGSNFEVNNVKFSDNFGIDVVIDDDAYILLNKIILRSNIFRNDATPANRGLRKIGGISTSQITQMLFDGNTDGQISLASFASVAELTIINNMFGSDDITVTATGDILVTCVANNNCVGTVNFTFTATAGAPSSINQFLFNGNSSNGTLTLSTDEANDIVISSNRMGGNISLSGIATSITNGIVSNNIADNLSIPPTAAWIGGSISFNKIVTNWSSTGGGFTTGTTNVFCWGNTSATSTLITFAGATNRTIANTNNGAGAGITPV